MSTFRISYFFYFISFINENRVYQQHVKPNIDETFCLVSLSKDTLHLKRATRILHFLPVTEPPSAIRFFTWKSSSSNATTSSFLSLETGYCKNKNEWLVTWWRQRAPASHPIVRYWRRGKRIYHVFLWRQNLPAIPCSNLHFFVSDFTIPPRLVDRHKASISF